MRITSARLRRGALVPAIALVALGVIGVTPGPKADGATTVNVPLGGDVAAAVAAVGESGGGTVVLASGTYTLSGPIGIYSNTTLIGQGPSTVIQASPLSPGSLIEAANPNSTANVTIEDLVLEGNVHRNTFLSNSSGGTDNPYGVAAIFMFSESNSIYFINISGVTVRDDGEALQMGLVNGLTLDNDNFYDNNPGQDFAHDVYLVACEDVSINNSYFDSSSADGLHMDFTSLGGDSITHSDFSHDTGFGVLLQGGASGVDLSDDSTDFDGDDGINEDSNNASFTEDRGSDDGGFALNSTGGSGEGDGLYGFADRGGFPPYQTFAIGLENFLISDPAPNTYPAAEVPTGVVGPDPTADWTTADGGGSSGVGNVDFVGYPTGSLSFSQVGAVNPGSYAATLSYANPDASPVTMALKVNGQSDGDVTFPSTGSATSFGAADLTLPLQAGNNVVTLSVEPGGSPVLDALTVDAPTPPAPATPTDVAANPSGPYQVDLSWAPVPGAQSYTVARGGVTIATGVTSTDYSDESLPFSGDSVGYTVTAVNQGGDSAASATVSAVTPPDAPQITGYTAGSTGNTISWFTVNGATAYAVKRSGTEGGPYTTIATVADTTSVTSTNFEQSYTDATAQPNQTYFYVVSSVYAGGQSADSAEAGSPLTPITTVPGNGMITVTWAGPQATGSDDTVRATPGGKSCVTAGPTSCTVTGLTNGQLYRLTITADGAVAHATATPYPTSVMNAADGMSLWLDGSDPSTEYTSPSCTGTTTRAGQPVGCWADKSTAAEDFSQTVTADQPTLGSSAGRSAIRLTNPDQVLDSTDGQDTYQTVFIATVPDSTPTSFDELFGEQNTDFSIRLDPVDTLADPDPGDWAYGTGDPAQEYTDGVQATEPALGAPVIIDDQSAVPETLAASVSSTIYGRGLLGDIDEVIAFKGDLGPQQRQVVLDYLAHKWEVRVTPGPPVGVRAATPGAVSESVSWKPPVSDGRTPITSYTVTAAPGGATCRTAGATSCAVAGLRPGVSYRFTVQATNAIGAGAVSKASAAVRVH